MRKCFNTTGACYPDVHYMVNMESRLEEMKVMIGRGEYFAVNRARQYGKTTILHLLAEELSGDYAVISVSFEGIEDEVYSSAEAFCQRFCRLLYKYLLCNPILGVPDFLRYELKQMRSGRVNMEDLSDFISELCGRSEKSVVLIIDEVDQAGNQKIFLTFLGMLRRKFLVRRTESTFRSVILAGVHDVKNLKLKMRPDAEHQYNSPWNIAADFTVDMSFSAVDIECMLEEYKRDVPIGMNAREMAELLYEYTSGYPFLVSRLCKIMDEQIPGKEDFPNRASAWTREGFLEAVKRLLIESNTLFDDMVKKLDDFPELKQALYRILFKGERVPYNIDNHAINLGLMFGFMKLSDGMVQISNRIFETRIYNLFISEELLNSEIYKAALMDRDRNRFICDGKLDMEQVLERFVESFTDIYSDAEEAFLEENGRRFFLLYLKPIINGVGNFYVEARTRNMRRTDVVIDYRGQQFVCELKIWHGEEYNKRGEEQLADYLDSYHLTTEYMISFNFIGRNRQEFGKSK